METRYILRKQLATLHCKFILGSIGHSKALSSEGHQGLLSAIEKNVGLIEEVLPIIDFPNPPESYFKEMGSQPLSTTIFILGEGGAYTDLHHIKKKTEEVEKQFLNPSGQRIFNINPGAIGTYGLCLSSHKSTGGRPDMSTYAYGSHPHLFFGGDSYYERIARWTGKNMELINSIKEGNRFPEYYEEDRMKKLDELVRTLEGSDVPVELLSDKPIKR